MAGELKLHDYQDRAVDDLYPLDRCVLVAEMGAGKTAIMLTLISELIRDGEIERAWIIAPKRVAQIVWPEEAAKWAPELDLRVVRGTPRQRRLALEGQVVVINFELLQGLAELDMTGLVLIDELSRFKNPQSKRRRAFKRLAANARMVFGMTGTPSPKGEIDLWAQVNAVFGDREWGRSYYRWESQHFYVGHNGYDLILKEGAGAAIRERFSALALHVEPPTRPLEPILLRDVVHLPPQAQAEYEYFAEHMVGLIRDSPVMTETPAALTMKCRQLASGGAYTLRPSISFALGMTDVEPDEEADWSPIWTHSHNAKLDALEDIVADSGERVLVLYQFTPEADAIMARFPGARKLGGGVSDAEAAETIAAWNRGEVPVLVGHPASMAHGIQLQFGGRRVVWFTLTWSLEEYEQANARIARQGQTQQVYVHHILANGTIDQVVLNALIAREQVQSALVSEIRDGRRDDQAQG